MLDITTGNAGNGERVFIAGGGGFNSAAAWNIGGGGRIWRIRADGDVQAVRFANNNVYFGFHDGYLGNTTLRLLAADAATNDPNGLLVGLRARVRWQHRRDGHRHRRRRTSSARASSPAWAASPSEASPSTAPAP